MTQAIASVITAIGVIFAGISLRGSQLQRNRQFEALYIERYWSLIDRISPEAGVRHEGNISLEDRHVVTLDLQLCEDQIEMYKRGWITRRTFCEWSDGMRASVKTYPVKVVWQGILRSMERPQSDEPPFAYLRKLHCTTGLPKREVGFLRLWLRGV